MTAPLDRLALDERLRVGMDRLGVHADAEQRECLLVFIALLARWNRTYNLTSVRDPGEMVPRHLLDSLSVNDFLSFDRILDAGTGPGLPGIPLAVLNPSRQFTLLDSNGKKTRFVQQATLELGLDNVRVVRTRLESYRPERKFATIVSRAVSCVSRMLADTEHLLARPGQLLAMKGRFPGNELDSLRTHAPTVRRLRVPFLDGERHLIEINYD